MTDQDYGKLVNEKSKPSPMWKNMLGAFVVGGLICCIGQAFQEWYQNMGLSKTDAGTAVTITLVLLSALLTGLDLYAKIAKHAGAGTLVPVVPRDVRDGVLYDTASPVTLDPRRINFDGGM